MLRTPLPPQQQHRPTDTQESPQQRSTYSLATTRCSSCTVSTLSRREKAFMAFMASPPLPASQEKASEGMAPYREAGTYGSGRSAIWAGVQEGRREAATHALTGKGAASLPAKKQYQWIKQWQPDSAARPQAPHQP